MLTHIVYDKGTGEIIQTHIEYSAEDQAECTCDNDEVLTHVDPRLDRGKLGVVRVDLPGRISSREKSFSIDVKTGTLKEEEPKVTRKK